MLDERSSILLKTLIEHYVADGAPVGSRSLSRVSGLELSPATIRNVMADLEEAGFIVSPHTSAGRIPTALGYRVFVDRLLTSRLPNETEVHEIGDTLHPCQPQQQLLDNASRLLSQLTHFVGIVTAPRRAAPVIRQIEFLRLSEKRILLILITQEGNVQNRILLTPRDYSDHDLGMAGKYLNQYFSGLSLDQIRDNVRKDLQNLRNDLKNLMSAVLEASDETLSDTQSCVISGEKNLLDATDLTANIERLRELFELFEHRSSLMSLLEHSCHAEGIQIFIGGESGIAPLDECSVITAPYEADGQVLGSLAVIGPTRMAYERVIPVVNVTARLLSSALSSNS
ncbi:MAG: heat-inducible transcriptional repressor HrcA [Zoogloeaceae bacterium]|jgi:heat-inducible transcriptional repressor|nr:heat-inducible transcriptional repressor HrcA [Zoogloeaceae bacterium]